ncbi:MAG: sortase [Methanobacterium sp.]|uniref:class E sortase n=1 Tax=Methanobacterium sp. TaxID=2164 RepID=UPI003D6599F9|nr:sortase [Methanobacterium sp.]
MLRYKLLSVAVVGITILIIFSMIMAGFEKSQELGAYQATVHAKVNKSVPVNVLYPTSSKSASGGATAQRIVIPKIGVDASIRSDTVNSYNAVYHYTESVEPGQNGECGFLSHRTTYSGLFGKLGSLKVGDEVIIKDYAKSKKYTYKVTSNGNDIRWDYKQNPIEFDQSGEARLLLVTCYPPGKKQAAYICHCKLVSTTPLK